MRGHAAAPSPLSTFVVEQKSESFTKDEKRKLTITAECLVRRKSCRALDAFARAGKLSLPAGSPPDQATWICGKVDGRPVVGRDAQGNENGFCKFKDGSLIDVASLFAATRDPRSN